MSGELLYRELDRQIVDHLQGQIDVLADLIKRLEAEPRPIPVVQMKDSARSQPQWRDVTADCEIPTFSSEHCEVWDGGNRLFCCMNGYRLRKVECHVSPLWAFIVEKREP